MSYLIGSKEGKERAGPVSETRKLRVLTLSSWVGLRGSRGQEQQQYVAQRGLEMELCVQKRTQSRGVPLPL